MVDFPASYLSLPECYVSFREGVFKGDELMNPRLGFASSVVGKNQTYSPNSGFMVIYHDRK